jgi:hypothetical protein
VPRKPSPRQRIRSFWLAEGTPRWERWALVLALPALAAIVGVFGFIWARVRGSDEHPRAMPPTQPASPAMERDPESGERPIAKESSGEFFRGDLTVSIREIRRVQGELRISHVAIRAEGGKPCDLDRIGNGTRVGVPARGYAYFVSVRALDLSSAAVVGFRTPRNSDEAGGCFFVSRLRFPERDPRNGGRELRSFLARRGSGLRA